MLRRWRQSELTSVQRTWLNGVQRDVEPPPPETFCEPCLGTGHQERPFGWIECPSCLGRRSSPRCPRCGRAVEKHWAKQAAGWEIEVRCDHCGWED